MQKQNDTIIHTVADELFELVKKEKKVSVEDAAKQLKMPLPTVQALVDFLVEEKVFGIEYKFTTPFIYLYKEGVKQSKGKGKNITKGLVTKEEFYEKAKQRKIPYAYIEEFWRKYLQQNMAKIREEFLRKAKQRKVSEEKIEELWNMYLSYL
jgi:predicted ArsR family transcriptional regulator|tara:strand:+ start:7792 stop:8247 length:456 start_codon:yes stop_codon:yes gene_type:complete